MASTLPGVAAGLWNYDANDRLTAGDTYDANGNTISSGGIGNVYDFENRLIQKGGVTTVYDGDGNRVAKTVAGVTTRYLVDVKNPTGYAQVIAEEFANTTNSATYIYGLERIARGYYSNQSGGVQGFRYYLYDGHGSVRALADTSGNVTDTYDYDAFGNLIHSTFTSVPPLGSTVSPSTNNYLYSGEQFDPDLNLYYNRARYLNVSTGRFINMDTFEGSAAGGFLHKYSFPRENPVDLIDPSGHEGLAETAFVSAEIGILAGFTALQYGQYVYNTTPSAIRGTILHEAIYPFYRANGFVCNAAIGTQGDPPVDYARPDCRHPGNPFPFQASPFTGEVMRSNP
jgi:RHS repeat-associated protein